MQNYGSNFQILDGPSRILKDDELIKLEIQLPHDRFDVVSTYNLSSQDCFTLLVHITDTSKSLPYSNIAAQKKIIHIKFDDVLLEIDRVPSEGIQILIYNAPYFNATDNNEITALIRKYNYNAFKYFKDNKKSNGGILHI